MDAMQDMIMGIDNSVPEETVTLAIHDAAHRLACEWRWQKNMEKTFLENGMKEHAERCAAIRIGIEAAAQAVSIEIYQAFCDKSGAEDTAGIVW